jgi:hypothetical protein
VPQRSRRHVGELELDRLEIAILLPNCRPLGGVAARDVVGRLRDADSLRGDTDPAAVQGRHRDGEPAVFLVQQAIAVPRRPRRGGCRRSRTS